MADGSAETVIIFAIPFSEVSGALLRTSTFMGNISQIRLKWTQQKTIYIFA